VVQRFGDGLRLNPHAHSLFADGVWHAVAGSEVPKFQRIKSPTQREIEALTLAVRRRVLRRLGRLGVRRTDLEDQSCDLFGEREPVWASCMTASLLDRVAIGGLQSSWSCGCDEQVEVPGNGKLRGRRRLNVHATTVAKARPGRARAVCKHLLRPTICNERLQRLEVWRGPLDSAETLE
jgi:hypothetical protein